MIKGAENLTIGEMHEELRKGAKFVVFQYAISLVLMTFRRSSDIHFIRAGEKTLGKSIGFSVLTFVMGWWGIPWGPIYSIGALFTNFTGGKDVTQEVLQSMRQSQAAAARQQAPPPVVQTPPPTREFQTPPRRQPDGGQPGASN